MPFCEEPLPVHTADDFGDSHKGSRSQTLRLGTGSESDFSTSSIE